MATLCATSPHPASRICGSRQAAQLLPMVVAGCCRQRDHAPGRHATVAHSGASGAPQVSSPLLPPWWPRCRGLCSAPRRGGEPCAAAQPVQSSTCVGGNRSSSALPSVPCWPRPTCMRAITLLGRSAEWQPGLAWLPGCRLRPPASHVERQLGLRVRGVPHPRVSALPLQVVPLQGVGQGDGAHVDDAVPEEGRDGRGRCGDMHLAGCCKAAARQHRRRL